jgi:hypothetical protein
VIKKRKKGMGEKREGDKDKGIKERKKEGEGLRYERNHSWLIFNRLLTLVTA